MSEMTILPPGRRTRATSRKTADLSGTRLMTQLLVTASTDASSTGNDSRRPGRNSTRVNPPPAALDRKSTRLNSIHRTISYAVFCLKKKKTTRLYQHLEQPRKRYVQQPPADLMRVGEIFG